MSPTRNLLFLGLLLSLLGEFAYAQPVAHFYKGKTIEIIVGFPPGAYNDVYSRLLASHMGKYIPGAPTFVVRNMPGAGSFLAVNHIYKNAPKDGTTIGLGSPTIALDEVLETDGVRYKARELGWIGRTNSNINILATWKNSLVKTVEQAKTSEVTLSGTGVGSTTSIYPIVMNNIVGTKFKMVMGYKGSNEGMLAMERGEAEGHSTSWTTFYGMHPNWFVDGSVNILVQFSLARHPQLKDVPAATEFAQTPEQKSILEAVLSATEIGYAFFTTPETPSGRLEILRNSFNLATRDPEFLAEAAKMTAEIQPVSGEQLEQLVRKLGSLSPVITEKIKSALMQK